MSEALIENLNRLPVAVIIGATSKWQADGRNTVFAHGSRIGDDDVPISTRWGLGGALAQKFAREGHFVVLTTRNRANASGLVEAVMAAGGACMAVEMDAGSHESVSSGFKLIREFAGDPDVLIYNAGYMAGRELSQDQELLEHFPVDLFEVALATACRGPFLVAKEVLPAMRERNRGSFFFSNNQNSLRGRKRFTGQSLYYPRTMMRALAQALTEEYSEFGVHVANVVVNGVIDSPGTRALDQFKGRHESLINPASIADAFFYLHQQDPSCWTHELQLTPSVAKPSF
ncbi:SDR family oxidoreductase [Streptomyces sp. 5-6(2022)]|uniref:SDR family oxidoreductase n=1 Tax=Streptomyces sp. 5-6(2022) TaxID=2936510 RepID=UPI0023BA0D45|nr:SDR family oxidoreductase [Streptomyces sp. 5-6(2022)]